jgi:hypothetical protein
MNKKHFLLMLACCLVPVVVLTAILFFQFQISQVLFFLLILLCPLSHILMMKFVGHGDVHARGDQHAYTQFPNPREIVDQSS